MLVLVVSFYTQVHVVQGVAGSSSTWVSIFIKVKKKKKNKTKQNKTEGIQFPIFTYFKSFLPNQIDVQFQVESAKSVQFFKTMVNIIYSWSKHISLIFWVPYIAWMTALSSIYIFSFSWSLLLILLIIPLFHNTYKVQSMFIFN